MESFKNECIKQCIKECKNNEEQELTEVINRIRTGLEFVANGYFAIFEALEMLIEISESEDDDASSNQRKPCQS